MPTNPFLRGATVKDSKGRTGVIRSVSLPWVSVTWGEGLEERISVGYRRKSQEAFDIKVYTIPQGWTSLGEVVGKQQKGNSNMARSSMQEALEQVTNALRSQLSEEDEGTEGERDEETLEEGCPECEEAERDARTAALLEGMLSEANKRNPFKYGSSLGPGPRDGENDKANYWKCTCSNYRCVCRGKKGEEHEVAIDREYKRGYNREYKAWRATSGSPHTRKVDKMRHQAKKKLQKRK